MKTSILWLVSVFLFGVVSEQTFADEGEHCLKLDTSQGCFKYFWNTQWQDCNSTPAGDASSGFYCDPGSYHVKGDDYPNDFNVYMFPIEGESGNDGRVWIDGSPCDEHECDLLGYCIIEEPEDEDDDPTCVRDVAEDYPFETLAVSEESCEYEGEPFPF